MAGAGLDAVAHLRDNELSALEAGVEAKRGRIGALEEELRQRRVVLNEARAAEKTRDEERRRETALVVALGKERRARLEQRAELAATAARQGVIEAEVEDGRSRAAQWVRAVEQAAADADQVRRAKRVMGIAVGRFSGHYLTERLMSVVPLPAGVPLERVVGQEEANLRAIEAVANVRLSVVEEREAIRLEGLDGVGRELARRGLAWLARQGSVVRAEAVEQTLRDARRPSWTASCSTWAAGRFRPCTSRRPTRRSWAWSDA